MGNKVLRAVAVLAMAAFLACTTSACFGRFELTRKIYNFNRGVSSDKWIRWCVFLVLAIVPVYGIGLLVDVLFANSVEFWSGSNPVALAPGSTREAHGPDGSFARATRLAGGDILFEAADGRGATCTYRLRTGPGGIAAYDADGRLVAQVVQDQGRMRLELR